MAEILIVKLSIIIRNCKIDASCISEALTLITDAPNGPNGPNAVHIVKIPNQLLSSILIHRQDNSIGFLADLVTNFRNENGEPVGHLDTNIGKIPIPKFWPLNDIINRKYGLPHREEYKDLLVDAYLLNGYWNAKIIELLDDLPHFTQWTNE